MITKLPVTKYFYFSKTNSIQQVVGNYSNDYDVQCQLDACKTYPVITDSERGEMICGGCGVLLVQNMADSSHENTGYIPEGFAKSARTGPATSLTIFDMGLSTVMGMDKDSTGKALPGKTKYEFKRLRMWDQRSKSKKDCQVKQGVYFTVWNEDKIRNSK